VPPVLDYFSSLFRREDWHIAATATPVSSLKEHEQSIAQCRIAVDGMTTSSNVDPNACDALINQIATSKPLVDLTKDSMALVLPSLAEIGVIDAIAA
jgi:hypothetical protein